MQKKRFHGKTGEEYKLFMLVCPHFEELQQTVGNVIRGHFEKTHLDEIRVLEIGCGPGYTTTMILDSDTRTNIVAVDNESVMIEQAKEVLASHIDNKRVELIQSDALEFLSTQDSNSFDVFASGFTLHNFSKAYREKTLKEIYRVLKKDGIFVNADKYAFDDEAKHKESFELQLTQIKEQYHDINRPDLAEEWTQHYLEDNKPELLMREQESIDYMSSIGFKNVEIVFRKQMEAVLVAKK